MNAELGFDINTIIASYKKARAAGYDQAAIRHQAEYLIGLQKFRDLLRLELGDEAVLAIDREVAAEYGGEPGSTGADLGNE